MGILERMREDIQTVFAKDPAARSTLEVLTSYPGLHAIWLHRVAHRLWRGNHLFLARFLSHITRWLTGIEIHPGATIGRRFFIDHGMGVVIGETAEIGEDVLLYQGVVLGGTTLEKKKRHPTLGNNVVIGAGSIVLGAITLGDNSTVGAGSVVVRPVPPGTTVVGVPARVTGRPEAVPRPVDLEHGRLADPVARAISESLDRQSRLEERVRRLEALVRELPPGAVAAEPPPPPTREELVRQVDQVLNDIIDPEAGTSIVELGLVQEVDITDERVRILLYIPTTCPFTDYLQQQVNRRLLDLPGVNVVDLVVVNERTARASGPQHLDVQGVASNVE